MILQNLASHLDPMPFPEYFLLKEMLFLSSVNPELLLFHLHPDNMPMLHLSEYNIHLSEYLPYTVIILNHIRDFCYFQDYQNPKTENL